MAVLLPTSVKSLSSADENQQSDYTVTIQHDTIKTY